MGFGGIIKVVTLVILISISTIGVINMASAHTGPNDTVPTTNHTSYIYGKLNVDCSAWKKSDNTTPLGGDTDRDTICDAWEINSGSNAGLVIDFITPSSGLPTGVPTNHKFYYKLQCDPATLNDCPDPTKRDLYVELDWMRDTTTPDSHAPLPGVISDLITAFSNAPFLDLNNNGIFDSGEVQAGVNLHIQYGEDPTNTNVNKRGEIPFHNSALRTPGTDQLPGFYRLKEYYAGTANERSCSYPYPVPWNPPPPCSDWQSDAIKDRLTAKRQAFHYGLIINQQYGNTFSGWSETVGNDFVISLGTFTPPMGSVDQQEGTIMHELGHTLSLRHGGDQDWNCKPNYLSVMSFTFQFAANADSSRPLDYSKAKFNDLNENNGLDENAPSVKPLPPDPSDYFYPGTTTQRKVIYSTTSGSKLEARVNDAINWNGGNPNENPVTQNINNLPMITGCSDSTYVTSLTGYDDWQKLNFDIFGANFGGTGQGSGADMVPDEENGEKSEGSGPNGITIPAEIQYQEFDSKGNVMKKISPEGNEMKEAVSSEGNEVKIDMGGIPGTGIPDNGIIIPAYSYTYSTHGEITYDVVREFYHLHLVDIMKKIDSLNDNDFVDNNANVGRETLNQYVLTAMKFNQKDNLPNISAKLAQLKVKADELISSERKPEVLSLLDDKIKSFAIGQDTGGVKPPTDDSGMKELTNTINELGKKIEDLTKVVTELANKVSSFWNLIIGLIIIIIIMAIVLLYRNRRERPRE